MRRLLFLFAGAGLALAVIAPAVANDGGRKFEASLSGYLETPSVSTAGSGSFRLRIHDESIDFSLSFRNLTDPAAVAHIHFGRPDVAGGVSVFLCGGGGRPACPASGTVTGTIVPANVVGPTAQGITANEFAELVRAIRHGATYVNIHTPTFPNGEIRGNIHDD
jgi:CHRD domain-containing protein